MSVIVAQTFYIFGLRAKVLNNIGFVDEQTIIFPSGNNCVKYNIDQKWQKFITGSEKSQGMQALAISLNRRYLAISEKGLEKATVTIYELTTMPCKKRKVLSISDVSAQEFVSMAFSPDSKYLVAQTGAPDWILIYWMWEKQKIMATIKTDLQNNPVYQIPQDQHSSDPAQSDQQEIVSMCLSPSEEILIISTNKSQLYSITLSSAEMSKGEEAHFEYLTHSLHSASITGLDTCIRKPLIATCSLDRSIRIWNYETNILELYKEFQEEAYSISLHPSGLYILVGFFDKLRLMNLLIDDIRSFKEFTVRGCRECSFSHGGHLFATVNGNVIHIYSTSTFENITNLKGHNGKVRSVVWSADDSRLVSCGMDGAVYEWNTLLGKRESECVLKSCSYSSVAISADAKTIFAVGSDKTLKEICDSQILREVPSFDMAYTAVVVSHSGRMVFTGTSNGVVRSMKYPLPVHKEYNEYIAHAGPITKMAVSYDDQYLLTISEDSCLLIWKIMDKEGRGLKREKDVGYAEEVLITKSDLEEKNQVMLELKTRVEELKMENEYQLRLKDMNYNEKIKELTEKFIQEMESLKTKNQLLKTDKEKQELKNQDDVAEILENHSREVQDLESSNNQKLMLEYEKYEELQVKSQRMQEEYEKQLQEMDDNKSQALEELTEYYEAKVQDQLTVLEQAQDDSRQQLREFEETKKQIEEDADREIQDIKIKYERRLYDERESNLRLRGETGIMRKKFSSLQKEIEERNTDIEKMKVEHQKLQGIIKSLEKDILGLKKEIHERDETIQDKEKRIYDLKKKNQELEKFKFVLDYKIKELKKQIEPRENEIREKKDQIQEMEAELERFHKQNSQLELNITELRQKLKATDHEMRKESQKVRNVEAVIKRFKTDLHDCVGLIQEPKQLKDCIRELYGKYVQESDVAEIVGVDADIQQEYARQREHLERSLATLKIKLRKDSEIHRADNVRVMQENVSLIKEINDLRRELKVSRTHAHDLECILGLKEKNRKSNFNDIRVPSSEGVPTPGTMHSIMEEEEGRIIEMQRMEIKRLRDQIQVQEQMAMQRPPSGGKLPTLTA
ncbi:cilia- and flagella-associated protein 57 isoform X2 [Rhinatrema bivittatum]|uniref:cilia- and flagella-associated protein 57 isoform X2 n=1 Tax=Rhinatrema bivittatum TaxID=194408 RepID=UPI00112861B6|nr:cilia- and flagella-associated protein 57 isoform X2 [Rhinatrema bivittatum]